MSVFAVPLALIRISFVANLAYRLRFYTGVISYLIYVLVYTSIWKAVYATGAAGGPLAEFQSFEALFTYFAVGWLARSFCFNNVDRTLTELVESGHIAARVARPVSLHLQMLCEAIGEAAFRAAFFSPILLTVLVVFFGFQPPASLGCLLAFLASLVLSIVVMAELNFLVGLTAFKTQSTWGIMRAKQYLIELLSGLLIPLSYFPDVLRTIAYCTPFPVLTSIPNRLYLGLVTGAEAWASLGVSAAWAVGLFVVAIVCDRAVSKSLQVQGG
ncbi:MAG: ABC-2 family transporter protein [Planctomycetes bacterium]|nr:ABC-2 family transporter protein [Planctomycetota bacterium]MCC7172601.1 ABC-2 family transporter protein [Planctomycetota bacterium]